MSNTAIRVENLGKMYRIGGKQEKYQTLRDTLADAFTGPFKRARNLMRGQAYGAANLTEEIWALKDVSFEVKHGEVVGIIGRNGAGKSTLLKILSRITEPTEGMVDIYGRVGSLLEVGTGFHPELTGRENVYLNGAILGMSRRDIDRQFDEIVDFAGVEKFIDTPVKHYSSGMGLRLGFAVAAHLEPEILVVDEVLAVGDAEFQKKCLGKMQDVAGEGRTVLFVSHNMGAVRNLCNYTIWLTDGVLTGIDATENIVSAYLRHSSEVVNEQIWDLSTAPTHNGVSLQKIKVYPINNTDFTIKTPLCIEIEIWNHESRRNIDITLHVITDDGIIVFASNSVTSPEWGGKDLPTGLFNFNCIIPSYTFNSQTYKISILIVQDLGRVLLKLPDIVSFNVIDDAPELRGGSIGWQGKVPGVVRFNLIWNKSLKLSKND